MSEADLGAAPRPGRAGLSLTRWRNRLAASRRFQSWASRMPIARGFARRDGEALFDLLAGFVHAQVLHALIELRLLHLMMDGPMAADALARRVGAPGDRMRVLLRAGVALGLMRLRRDGRFALTRQGAAITGVPGLEAMILHHRAFYRDLEDPAAFFRDGGDTELARFWPYVFGAAGKVEPEVAARYSGLMADSQALVAEETLRAVSLRGVRHLMDVGGGSGAFLEAVALGHPELKGTLFDLPQVAPAAEARFRRAGLDGRIDVVGGSFRDMDLPRGADAISLVRVLYDHSDETVALLLRRVRAALPSGGRLVVSEPMTGGPNPARPGDTYFALYTMAMGTGRARSSEEIGQLMQDAGFTGITPRRTRRPFVTSVIEARVA